MKLTLCRAFDRMVSIMLASVSSGQATVRSKSLKSVIHLLETDPTILDCGTTILQQIMRSFHDVSAQVRESALILIAKCIAFKPDVESGVVKGVISLTHDVGVGVRKRAMKLSRDIYLRSSKREMKLAIAENLLYRVEDIDEGISDLARQMIE